MRTRILLTVLMIGMTMGAVAQKPAMALTFTAENNGQYVPLDSIFIENLSQGCDTNLYAPDTVLVLDYITGIGYIPNTADNTFSVSQNYPNPFTYSTNVDLYISDHQDVNIYVRDLIGRELSRLTLSLQKGAHSFTIYPGQENIYLISFSGERASKTIKLLNTGSGSERSSQCKVVYNNTCFEKEYSLKAAETSGDFTFDLGDLLRFTGYAITLHGNPGSDTIEDAPLTDSLYVFNINGGDPVLPTVTTDSITEITNNSATGGGEVILDGGADVTACGVCWSTSPNPTTSDDHTVDGSGIGTFVSNLTGLTSNTLYYVRAYATNSVGTAYGNEITFTTLEDIVLPTVTTDTATNITQTQATSGGEVTSDGGAYVTVRGVCWSTSPNPTTSDDHTVDGSGIGTFVSNLTGLTANALYYVRAYATNSVGTAYGNEISFYTLPLALPTVTTSSATFITDTTALSGGEVTSNGGTIVTARGVCWSTSTNPTTADDFTVNGSGIGAFLSLITGLTPHTQYYVRAYATNSLGTAYGNEINFTTLVGPPCPGMPTVTDIDGNVYNTVLIGTQCWMLENLKTTKYNNNTPIPNVTDPTLWSLLTIGAYVWYDNDISWKDSYGAMYNWYATAGPNNLCPTGWHVPTHADWTDLTNYIGGTAAPHGNELKSCRQVNSPLGGGCNTSEHPRWNQHNTHYGTDNYGFSGLPGGIRRVSNGVFDWIGYHGSWWSTTEYSSTWAYPFSLRSDWGHVNQYQSDKKFGFSVRCLRDE